VTRPHAADEFATIRAHMEELRRERAQGSVRQEGRSTIAPRPDHGAVSSGVAQEGRRLLLRSIRRNLIG
jgi:hypothetical protein